MSLNEQNKGEPVKVSQKVVKLSSKNSKKSYIATNGKVHQISLTGFRILLTKRIKYLSRLRLNSFIIQ